jgi:hypothetical protein
MLTNDARRFLYDAAESLDAWGESDAGKILRTAAEILGADRVARLLRLDAAAKRVAGPRIPYSGAPTLGGPTLAPGHFPGDGCGRGARHFEYRPYHSAIDATGEVVEPPEPEPEQRRSIIGDELRETLRRRLDDEVGSLIRRPVIARGRPGRPRVESEDDPT